MCRREVERYLAWSGAATARGGVLLLRNAERAHDALRNVRPRIPLKRHGTESEIAGAIVYLLSPAAAYITGATLRIDGGLHNNGRGTFYEVPDHDRSKPYNGFPLYRAPKVLR